ncbi:uncharacterized protein LOC105834054 [Monomorium pharaonis]|uniref:uncharacterized protein LOC105834054 n=1 Tax=Monomorium pharaonis TaxID=307658 RepID=UPI00063F8394|nr:uncharacterized protein LOC105834054 [Monomorium pharaonis]
MLFYVLSIFSIAIIRLTTARESEFSVLTCKRGSVDYDACLKQTLETTWPLIVKAGLAELDLPSLDPLYYKDGKIELNTDTIHAKVIILNFTCFGLLKTHFIDLKTHFLPNNVLRLEIDVQVPKIFVEGIIKINGTLNVFTVAGEGYMNATMSDIKGACDLIGHIINNTLLVEHFRFTPTFGTLKVYFNLFQNDRKLNDLALMFINEYWPTLYREIWPIMSDMLDPWLSDFANKFFSKILF